MVPLMRLCPAGLYPRIAFRILAAVCVLSLATPALAAGANGDPAAPIVAIYKRIVASYDAARNNTGNGYFIWKNDKTRRRYFSARTATLWRNADKLTVKGDQGPMGFDPVTNSQDPLVLSFDTAIETQDPTHATVIVRISSQRGVIAATPPGLSVHYDMVRERGRWVIDDIRSAIGSAWSLRQLLASYRG